jgi:hypothetical protein
MWCTQTSPSYFQNWFHSTQVNINSLSPMWQHSFPCTNSLRIHTILPNVERLVSHGLHCTDFFTQLNFMENFWNECYPKGTRNSGNKGTISLPSLSKWDSLHTFLWNSLIGIMWQSYCTKLHPIQSWHLETTSSSFMAQNITVTWLWLKCHMFKYCL